MTTFQKEVLIGVAVIAALLFAFFYFEHTKTDDSIVIPPVPAVVAPVSAPTPGKDVAAPAAEPTSAGATTSTPTVSGAPQTGAGPSVKPNWNAESRSNAEPCSSTPAFIERTS